MVKWSGVLILRRSDIGCRGFGKAAYDQDLKAVTFGVLSESELPQLSDGEREYYHRICTCPGPLFCKR